MGVGLGALVAFVLIPLLGVPGGPLGVVLAGFIAGLVAGGGPGNGAKAAFLGGLLIGFVLAGLVFLMGVGLGSIGAWWAPLASVFAGIAILIASFVVGILAAIGGALGGLLRGKG